MYVLQVERLERHMNAVTAGLMSHASTQEASDAALGLLDQSISAYEAALEAEPQPESASAERARRWGVA